MTKIIWLVTSVLLLNGVATAQIASLDQSAAITKTALDYIEGWYAGDATHGTRASSRIGQANDLDRSENRAQPIQSPGRDGARPTHPRRRRKKTPPDRQLKEVTILDRYNNAAVVKIVASDWIDYLEVAKFNGEWKIINVLWELKPKPATQ